MLNLGSMKILFYILVSPDALLLNVLPVKVGDAPPETLMPYSPELRMVQLDMVGVPAEVLVQ